MRSQALQITDILRAYHVVRRNLEPTPLRRYESLSRMVGADVFVKHDHVLPSATSWVRGAVALAFELKKNGIQHVVSSGPFSFMHALATACRMFSMKITLFVDSRLDPQREGWLADQNAEVMEVEGGASNAAARFASDASAYFVDPFEEPLLICGMGTVYLELFEAQPDVDVLFVPVGSGMLAAAAAIAVRALSPRTTIIGVCPQGEEAVYRSWRMKMPRKIPAESRVEWLNYDHVKPVPFSYYAEGLQDFVQLPDAAFFKAAAVMLHHTRMVVDPASAGVLAAACARRDVLQGRSVALLMPTSNMALSTLMEITLKEEVTTGDLSVQG
ncbi:PLP-dependent lyase/thiolase [Hahella sp. SMD15-11]|uniref:PLP-dependent lyase/thiolase n=1 Tax=Thermohahella caldifontis TaxID=3142973 RepID=A0AB39UYC9_9GAMM